MAIPLILHSLPYSSIFLQQGVNFTEGDDSLLRLLLITSHKNMACTWHDVFACTLLHCELRDYSLGQIVLLLFERFFAIT